MNEAVDLWRQAILLSDATIHQAIRNLNETAIKIVLIVNHHGEFEGTLSDGDIRRGILKGLDIHSPIASVIRRNPLVVPPGMNREMVVQLMMANKIQQIPVVDENNALIGLHLWDELTTPVKRPNVMIIMAGGKGTRLLPHTDHCPKPMVQVAGKPMLQHIVERAKLEGFRNFIFAIHHLGHMIEEYFENGTTMDVHIEYVREEIPLGTVGALALLHPRPNASFVVTNGDVLTDVRYGELLDFHNRHKAAATMAVRLHEWQHPFGVVHTKGIEIVGFEEKPITRSHINAGIYALSPDALDELEAGKPCDMPALFERLQAKGKQTVAYPMHEPWLDVGRPLDLDTANKTYLKNE